MFTTCFLSYPLSFTLCLRKPPPRPVVTLYLPHFLSLLLFSGLSVCRCNAPTMMGKVTEASHGHRGRPTFALRPNILLESDVSCVRFEPVSLTPALLRTTGQKTDGVFTCMYMYVNTADHFYCLQTTFKNRMAAFKCTAQPDCCFHGEQTGIKRKWVLI